MYRGLSKDEDKLTRRYLHKKVSERIASPLKQNKIRFYHKNFTEQLTLEGFYETLY